MDWKKVRGIDKENLQSSNVLACKGSLENIGDFICPDGIPSNFVISGGAEPGERYQPLYRLLDSLIGRCPVVVLHNRDSYMETMVVQSWKALQSKGRKSPLWVVNQRYNAFEPFYGMTEMQTVTTFRQMAKKLNYSVSSAFERVVKAHCTILKELNIPVSLSGFYYLSQFNDMEEFYNNIMELPCGEASAKRIWSDLGTDLRDRDSQFELFRVVVSNLAYNASQSGWNPDNNVAEYNCLQAIKNNATFVLAMNDMYTELLLSYLVEELKSSERRFMLILDEIKISDSQFIEYLRRPNSDCICGILAENVVDSISGAEDDFLRLTEKMNSLVFFKHSTGRTATTLSEIMGRYDYIRIEKSHGTNRGVFSFLPRDRHDDVRYSTENRFRVMPEEITSLKKGQAIIFDTKTDRIIHYN